MKDSGCRGQWAKQGSLLAASQPVSATHCAPSSGYRVLVSPRHQNMCRVSMKSGWQCQVRRWHQVLAGSRIPPAGSKQAPHPLCAGDTSPLLASGLCLTSSLPGSPSAAWDTSSVLFLLTLAHQMS